MPRTKSESPSGILSEDIPPEDRFERIPCPKCRSTQLSVVQTVKGCDEILRRRRCVNGHSFITCEAVTDSDEYNRIQKLYVAKRQANSHQKIEDQRFVHDKDFYT